MLVGSVKFSLKIYDMWEKILVNNFLTKFDLVIIMQFLLLLGFFDVAIRPSGNEFQGELFDGFCILTQNFAVSHHIKTWLDDFDEITTGNIIKLTEDALEDFFVICITHGIEENDKRNRLI